MSRSLLYREEPRRTREKNQRGGETSGVTSSEHMGAYSSRRGHTLSHKKNSPPTPKLNPNLLHTLPKQPAKFKSSMNLREMSRCQRGKQTSEGWCLCRACLWPCWYVSLVPAVKERDQARRRGRKIRSDQSCSSHRDSVIGRGDVPFDDGG